MAALQIYQFPCLSDNFGVLIHDPEANVTASIDAPEADKVSGALAAKGWRLTHILTTHHHHDHVGGHVQLKRDTGCTIVGPRGEAARIPGLDEAVAEGDRLTFGSHQVEVLETPGHTLGQVNYVIPDAKAAFCGDTLFAMGCGRVIEGTPRMMWDSLRKLMALPRDTSVYCGHEYTQANARFALTIEPDNAALQQRAREVDALRAAGQPTLPTTIGLELETNPFLRPHVPAIQRLLGMEGKPDWEVFAEIRQRKNQF